MPAATSIPILVAEFETINAIGRTAFRIRESTSRLELFMAKVPPIPTVVEEDPSSSLFLTPVPPMVMEPRKSVAERETAATGAGSASVPLFTVTLSSMASVLPPRKVNAALPSMPMDAPAFAGVMSVGSDDDVESGFAARLASPAAPDALGAPLSFWEVTVSCSRLFVLVLASLAPSLP